MTYVESHPENPSKRSLQRSLLGKILRHPHKTKPYTIVCLPGRKCWEVEYFLPYNYKTYKGVGPGVKKVIALEQDQEVFDLIQEKYKDNDMVEVLNISTTEFLYTYDGQVDFIYFDYYSYFSSRVKQDIEIMFERKVLSEGGKFVINFLGARESIADQIMQKRCIENLSHAIGYNLNLDRYDDDTTRCLAFNGLIGFYRVKPISQRMYSKNTSYVNATAPLWHRYKTLAGHTMLTGHFTLRSYGKNQSANTLKVAPDVWVLGSKQWSIKDWVTFVSNDSKQNYTFWRGRVKDFYDENHYTPSSLDLGRTSIRCLPKIVKDLGLCPRTDRTIEDIKGEIDRIYQRVGVVCPFTVAQAKLGLRSGKNQKMNVRTIIDYCEDKVYPHRLLLNPIKINIQQLKTIKEYLAHLQADKTPSSFSKYHNLYVTILDKDCSFKNAHNTKLVLEEALVRVGLTKDGEMTVQYTDQQLIDMYYKKDITINALASLRLISRPTMIKYLESLGVDVRHKHHRNRDKITPEKVLREFQKNESVIKTSVKFGVSTKYIKDILDGLGVAPAKSGGYINLDKQSLVLDYKSGMSKHNIAKKYNVKVWVVNSRLKEAGIKLGAPGNARYELPKDQVIADYESGLSCREVGQKHSVSSTLINRRLKSWGVVLRKPITEKSVKRGGENKVNLPKEEIIQDYNAGLTLYKIAKKHSVSSTLIRNRLKEWGVKKKSSNKQPSANMTNSILKAY